MRESLHVGAVLAYACPLHVRIPLHFSISHVPDWWDVGLDGSTAVDDMHRFLDEAQRALSGGDPAAPQLSAMVGALAWAEKVTVTASALLRRLPGQPDLAARLLRATLQPAPSMGSQLPSDAVSERRGSADSEVDSLQSMQGSAVSLSAIIQSGNAFRAPSGVSVSDAAERALLHALVQRQPLPGAHAAHVPKSESAEEWSRPLQTIRVLECECSGRAAHAGSQTNGNAALRHRLFSRVRQGELRLATVVISET